MVDIGEYDKRDRPHISIDALRRAAAYSRPAQRQERKPIRSDYVAHAQALLAELDAALPPVPDAPPAAMVANLPHGALIVVETIPPAPESRSVANRVPMELEVDGLVILRTARSDDRSEAALIFVPDAARQPIRDRIDAYGSADLGNAPRPDVARFEALESIVAASDADLFAPPVDLAGPAAWWELWVRPTLADGVAAAAAAHEFLVHPEKLVFPDTTVVLVHAPPGELNTFARATTGAIAEIRVASTTITPFLERGPAVGPADFVADLSARIAPAAEGAPVVAVLDTGVSGAHPLVAPGLAGAYAYDEAWGSDDHHPNGGHGTGLASLVLLGDLAFPMQGQGPVHLTHRTASMKLLPPAGFPPNAPQHYGLVTQGAVASLEVEHPEIRTYCLATSAPDFSPERPSSWSGALDQLAAGSTLLDGADPQQPASQRPKRLLLVAAGNVAGGPKADVLASGPIEDPAQSWNALTIGGCTGKVEVDPQDWPLDCLAHAGDLSPFSSMSADLAGDLTPIKPEVLFEAGNMLVGHDDYCGWSPALSLLAAGSDVAAAPLSPIWATSAATGLAGRFTGALEAALPDLWPETYRALAVQAAEWEGPIRARLIGRGASWKNGSKAEKQAILRRVGYGAARVDRAIASARNAVTLIAQAEMQPFKTGGGGGGVYNELHVYDLPWPKAALETLENEIVTMKVTLSYFVEPNLSGRAATRPDTYRSVGLRFVMKNRLETAAQFLRRINAAQEGERVAAEPESSRWLLGPKAISAGSLHCDVWRGRAIELAQHDRLAVYPVSGWWKSHTGHKRMNDKCRYTLLVSIAAPGQAVDLHAEVIAVVEVKAAEIAVQV